MRGTWLPIRAGIRTAVPGMVPSRVLHSDRMASDPTAPVNDVNVKLLEPETKIYSISQIQHNIKFLYNMFIWCLIMLDSHPTKRQRWWVVALQMAQILRVCKGMALEQQYSTKWDSSWIIYVELSPCCHGQRVLSFAWMVEMVSNRAQNT